jgi:hypothetical protein
MHEPRLLVLARVDLEEGTELGVRPEHQVGGGGGPPDLTRTDAVLK